VQLINERRPAGTPELKAKLQHRRKGPLAIKATPKGAGYFSAPAKDSIHLPKYTECGRLCFERVQRYYANDFKLLEYPTLSSEEAAA
jgi:hypothetical protein